MLSSQEFKRSQGPYEQWPSDAYEMYADLLSSEIDDHCVRLRAEREQQREQQ